MEASLATVFQSGLKTSGGTTTGGARGTGGYVGSKLKTDGSMRWATSDSSTLPLPFSMY
jgi:hypothetical protein